MWVPEVSVSNWEMVGTLSKAEGSGAEESRDSVGRSDGFSEPKLKYPLVPRKKLSFSYLGAFQIWEVCVCLVSKTIFANFLMQMHLSEIKSLRGTKILQHINSENHNLCHLHISLFQSDQNLWQTDPVLNVYEEKQYNFKKKRNLERGGIPLLYGGISLTCGCKERFLQTP